MEATQPIRHDRSADAVKFFMEHAGWSSYDPANETALQGRRRGAIELAQAEAWAASNGVTFTWGDDEPRDHVAEFDNQDQEPETHEFCVAVRPCPCCGKPEVVLASLGCIDDATPEYRRVIEAELASEAMFS